MHVGSSEHHHAIGCRLVYLWNVGTIYSYCVRLHGARMCDARGSVLSSYYYYYVWMVDYTRCVR